jgi:anionic cell wall polymer biosynthesis LytR-Cps2A-Psr (LCP) family protein
MRILEHTLQQKIDYYLIQDRFNFIDLIDLLGGVNINLDKPYADEYNLKPGKNNLDGYYAWEYIRFLDWRNVKMTVKSEKKKDLVRQDNFEMDPRTMEMTYEMRNQRQRYVLEGMRRSFQNLSTADQLYVIENFKNVFRTDMKADFLNMLYKDILSTPSFSYGNVPGYYSVEGSKLFFYPDLPSFEMIRKREIRTYLEKRKDKNQVVY